MSKKYSMKHLESDKVQAKVDLIKNWVEKYGRIWSRKVLYRLVSNQLIKDTSDSQYQQTCNLFQALRQEGLIPYEWFKDKKTTVLNAGIEGGYSFNERFEMLRDYYSRSSKSLQKYYVEFWTEKELSEVTQDLIKRTYDASLVMGEGFIGDIPLKDAADRVKGILDQYEFPVKIFYISDYDSEGDHTFHIAKEKLEKVGDVTVEKLFLTKEQVIDKKLIPNIGYRAKMLKPKTLKYHLPKKYVKDFIRENTDLADDGIVQYEFDQFPDEILNEVIENTICRYIDREIIINTQKLCREESKEWCNQHYVE